MTSPFDCPSRQELADFLSGEGADDRGERIAEHLAWCDRCARHVESIDRITAPLLAALRRFGESRGVMSRASDTDFTHGSDPGVTGFAGRRTVQAEIDLGGSGPEVPRVGPPGYEILGRLGAGGMGEVYKALHRPLNRLVALKVIRAGSGSGAERFRIEAQAIARLQHPNIVQIYEVGDDEGRPFLALEYIDGGSLDRALVGAPIPARRAAEILEGLAEAVEHAHGRGIIHRDLKPANVLLANTTGGEAARPIPKVTDFGIARLSESDSGMTREGDVLGTPAYMAPEQAIGRVDRIGPTTDVYSLGVILYEMLTGQVPFRGLDAVQTLVLIRDQEPVAPRRLNPKLPRDLETICLRCLAKEPGRRYASAAALADDLGRWLDGRPILARPVGPATRLRLWARRRPAIAALVAAVAVVGAAGVATVVGVERRARHAAESSLARETARFDLAAEAVGTFHSQVSQDMLLKQKGFAQTRAALLGQAREFYAKLGGLLAGQEDHRSMAALATSYLKLGDLELEIGRKAEAEATYRRGLALRESLARRPDAGPLEVAERAKMILKVGEAHTALAGHKAGKPIFEDGLKVLEPAVRDHPTDARLRYELADMLNDYGAVRFVLKEPDFTRESFERSLRLRRDLVRDHPTNIDYRDRLVMGLYNNGVLNAGGNPSLGLDLYRQAEAVRRGLVHEHPEKLAWKADLGRIVLGVSKARFLLKDREGGYVDLRRACEILEAVIRESPEVEIPRYDLSNALHDLAEHEHDDRRFEDECRSTARNLELIERLIADNADDGFVASHFRFALIHGAIARSLTGREDEALAMLERARPMIAARAAKAPSDAAFRLKAECDAFDGYLGWKLGKLPPREAVSRIDEALGKVVKLAANPEHPPMIARYYAMRSALGGVAGSGRSVEEGRADRRAAVDALRRPTAEPRVVKEVLQEPWFAAVVEEPEGRLLQQDLAMPARPFAGPR